MLSCLEGAQGTWAAKDPPLLHSTGGVEWAGYSHTDREKIEHNS